MEEARNELEAFTYRGRDYLEDSLFQAVSNDEQREKFEALISETGDWLYGDGYAAPRAEVRRKLAELKALETPITKRKLEQQKRPEEIKDLEAVIEQTEELIKVFTTKPPAPDANSLDEEEDSFVMPDVDVAPLAKGLGETIAWLAEKKAAQESKAAHEDPVFTIKELQAKKKQLNKLTTIIIQQQKVFENIKQQAAKEAKAKAASSSKSAASASAAAAASSAAEAEATPAETEATPAEATPDVMKEDVVKEKIEERKNEIHDEL